MSHNFSILIAHNVDRHDISRVPIFGTYKNAEDQLTVALLHIFKVGGEELLQEVVSLAGVDLQTAEMHVATQVPFISDDKEKDERGCRVDGFIYHECGYNLFMETKITVASINKDQLDSYRNIEVGCMQKVILYVTPHDNRPKELDQDEAWINWEDLLGFLDDYIKGEDSNSVLYVYVQNIFLLYDILVRSKATKIRKKKNTIDVEAELMQIAKSNLKTPVVPLENDKDEDVLVVGGRWGEPVALEYSFYACQPGRTFLPTRYMTFCHRNRIKFLFRIEGDPRDVHTLEGLVSPDYFSNKEPNYGNYSDHQKSRKFFKLQLVHIFQEPIENDMMSKNGKRIAYTQNQRYTTIGKILNATKTSEL